MTELSAVDAMPLADLPPAASPEDDWRSRFRTIDIGKGKGRRSVTAPAVENAALILNNDSRWKGVVAFDLFRNEIVATKPPPWRADDAPAEQRIGPWQASDFVRLRSWLACTYELELPRDAVADAVLLAAESNPIHPIRDWLKSLEWDGVIRVDSWLTEHLGVEASEYTKNVGRWFLIGAVARVFQPGCKLDTMIVLEGPQGVKKSTALRALFGSENFSDTPLEFDSKDRFLQIQGSWCHEIAELDGFDRSDTARVKSFLSSPTDKYRAPYDRGTVSVARQVVFAGTVNDETYLRDTENRRFWPVKVGGISLETIRAARSQIWAEALVRYLGGERWWPEAGELAACVEEQSTRVHRDEWAARVEGYLDGKHLNETSLGELLQRVFDLEPAKWSQGDQNRVARALRLLGWKRTRAQRLPGMPRPWIYQRPGAQAALPTA